MEALYTSISKRDLPILPKILRPIRGCAVYGSNSKNGYFRFGEPSPVILKTYHELKDEYNICLDLLYGAPAFCILLQHWKNNNSNSPIRGKQIMYLHCGGLEGISSQLTRYRHKGLISSDEIQV